jgi:hypothetical protein
MAQTVTVAQLQRSGVTLVPGEAIAIAQKLIHEPHPIAVRPPFGPPTPGCVSIDERGAVFCSGCDVTPAVSELAILLEQMLPPGTRMPGALRYTIARALLNVDIRPFDSLEEFSGALARFEEASRDELLRSLYERWRTAPGDHEPAAVTPFERRHPIPAAVVTELRRELRNADLELYALRAGSGMTERRGKNGRMRAAKALAVGLAAGLALIVSGEIIYHRDSTRDASAPTPSRTAAVSGSSMPVEDSRLPAPLTGDTRTGTAPTAGSSSVPVGPPQISVSPSRPLDRAPAPASGGADSADARPHDRPQASGAVAAANGPGRPGVSSVFDSKASAMFVHSGRTSARRSVLLSPDGDEELQVMMIADDGAKNLHVQPSPDGRRVAFDSDREGERGIYVAERDGSHVRRVSGAGYAAMPVWSPDSRQLAYVRAEPDKQDVSNLWLLSPDSGEQRRLTHYGSGQTWSPSWFGDGRRVAYTHDAALVILDLPTSLTQVFKSPIHGRSVRFPAVSPDGRHVIFQVDRHGVWLLDLKDSSMRCVLTVPTADGFAWTADGRRFAFRNGRTGEWGMWVMAPT